MPNALKLGKSVEFAYALKRGGQIPPQKPAQQKQRGQYGNDQNSPVGRGRAKISAANILKNLNGHGRNQTQADNKALRQVCGHKKGAEGTAPE